MHSANEHCSYTEVEDNSSKGKVINVSVGRGTAGSFSIKGFLGSAGGSVSMSGATDIVKCGPGNKPWTLVRFALNPHAYQVDGHDREFLQILGFTLKTGVGQSVTTDERSCIHCCCEKCSLLSNPVDDRKVTFYVVT